MGKLELFIHDPADGLPTLIKAGLVHVQFASIHPFLNGNGRLGRLLITLPLCGQGILSSPMLYLSRYLKQHRRLYYELLQTVRETGRWERWLAFLLDGVTEALGRPASSVLRVHHQTQQRPLLTIPQAVRLLGLSKPTVGKSVGHLVALGIVRETSGRQRGRIFVHDAYLRLLDERTEPLPPGA